MSKTPRERGAVKATYPSKRIAQIRNLFPKLEIVGDTVYFPNLNMKYQADKKLNGGKL